MSVTPVSSIHRTSSRHSTTTTNTTTDTVINPVATSNNPHVLEPNVWEVVGSAAAAAAAAASSSSSTSSTSSPNRQSVKSIAKSSTVRSRSRRSPASRPRRVHPSSSTHSSPQRATRRVPRSPTHPPHRRLPDPPSAPIPPAPTSHRDGMPVPPSATSARSLKSARSMRSMRSMKSTRSLKSARSSASDVEDSGAVSDGFTRASPSSSYTSLSSRPRGTGGVRWGLSVSGRSLVTSSRTIAFQSDLSVENVVDDGDGGPAAPPMVLEVDSRDERDSTAGGIGTTRSASGARTPTKLQLTPPPSDPVLSLRTRILESRRAALASESSCLPLRRRMTVACGGWSKPSHITPHFLLGNREDSKAVARLSALGVSHILIAARQLPPADPTQFLYCKVNILDSVRERLAPHYGTVFEFLDDVRASGTRCMLHCVSGVSRSVAFLIAYLMYRDGMTLDDAIHLVRSRRPIIAMNEGFRLQLAMYELQLRGFSSVAGSADPMWNFYDWNLRKANLPPAQVVSSRKSRGRCVVM